MAAQAVNTGALALFRTKRGIPCGTIQDNGGHGHQRLTVINNGRATIQANYGGKWWFETRIASATLQRFHQGALFAADVRTCTTMDDDIAAKIAAQYILTDQARLVSFFDGLLDLLCCQCQFSTH